MICENKLVYKNRYNHKDENDIFEIILNNLFLYNLLIVQCSNIIIAVMVLFKLYPVMLCKISIKTTLPIFGIFNDLKTVKKIFIGLISGIM